MRRRASTIAEAFVGMTLMTAVVISLAQFSVLIRKHLQASHHRRVAALQAANLLERAMALPWERLSESAVQQWELTPGTQRELYQAELQVTLDEQTEPVAAKQLSIRISWREGTAGRPAEVRLTGWKIRATGKEQP